MRTHTLAALSLCLLLTACGGSSTARFTLQFDTQDAARQEELIQAAQRVMDRRLQAYKKSLSSSRADVTNGVTSIMVNVSDNEGLAMLKDGLSQPFEIAIYKQVIETEPSDIVSEKFGTFRETGLDTEDVDWVSHGAMAADTQEQGFITIRMTPAGQAELQQFFKANTGETIGVFVRGLLISRKIITAGDLAQNGIMIDQIPSVNLAQAFADDVNVGLHVTFTAQ